LDVDLTRQNRIWKQFDVSTRAVARRGDVEYDYSGREKIALGQTTISYRGGKGREDQTDPYVVAKQIMVDPQRNPLDTGHEFYTRKNELDLATPFLNYRSFSPSGLSKNELHGPVYIRPSQTDFQGSYDFYDANYRAELEYSAREYISRTIPTQSHASVVQFLGELREGLPDILGFDWKKERKFKPSRDGGELSLAFGWLPFIRDLSKMFEAVVNSQQLIKQYVENSAGYGKTVRRVRTSDPRVELKSRSSGYMSGPPAGVPDSSTWLALELQDSRARVDVGNVLRFETETVTDKFTARYQYFLPEDDSIISRMENYAAKANYLLGIRLTPDVLWELTPWSWLADWQADIGTLLKSASAFASGDLVMQYAYFQRKTVREISYTAEPWTFKDQPPVKIDSLYRTVHKSRIRASPYGFGIKPGQLSSSQIDTIIAIVSRGGSKVPKTD